LEFAEDFQLQELGQSGHFGGAQVVENDLEHRAECGAVRI
jgi:hypothetical protein